MMKLRLLFVALIILLLSPFNNEAVAQRQCVTRADCNGGECGLPNPIGAGLIQRTCVFIPCSADNQCDQGHICHGGACTGMPCNVSNPAAPRITCPIGSCAPNRLTLPGNLPVSFILPGMRRSVTITGQCLLNDCRWDSHCPRGFDCIFYAGGDTRCEARRGVGCQNHHDCPVGRRCVANICQAPRGVRCQTDNDCPVGRRCVANICSFAGGVQSFSLPPLFR